MITEEQVLEQWGLEFASWKRHKGTKALLKKLKQAIDDATVQVIWNKAEHEDIVKGYIRAYTNILELTPEELFNDQ